jgi:hypothetical protein
MNRLTTEERRRTFLARHETRRHMLAQAAQPIAAPKWSEPPSWLNQVLGTGLIVSLLGVGWIAWQALAFHVPSTVVEALLPRL